MQKRTLVYIALLFLAPIFFGARAEAKTYEYYKTIANEEDYNKLYNFAKNITPDTFKYIEMTGIGDIDADLYDYVLLDHPEIWAASACYANFSRPYDYDLMKQDSQTFMFSIKKIIHDLGDMKDCNDFGKVKKIHDYIGKFLSYKAIKGSDITRSLGRALATREGCCVAYAKLFKLLCNWYQVESICLYSMTHCYNYVRLDGKWYGVDCTWDDGANTYNYFLFGEFTRKLHEDHKSVYKVPDLDYEYWEKVVKIKGTKYLLNHNGKAKRLKGKSKNKRIRYGGITFKVK